MFDYRVGIIRIDEDTVVEFSPLSVTPELGARGIADINVIGNRSVKLLVYVTDEEMKCKKEVRKYIDCIWTRVENQKFQKIVPYGKWVGYFEIELAKGDPPIAVG